MTVKADYWILMIDEWLSLQRAVRCEELRLSGVVSWVGQLCQVPINRETVRNSLALVINGPGVRICFLVAQSEMATASSMAASIASKTKTKKKHFVAQKVKLFRASDPLLSVLMWGVNHSVSTGAVCIITRYSGGNNIDYWDVHVNKVDQCKQLSSVSFLFWTLAAVASCRATGLGDVLCLRSSALEVQRFDKFTVWWV